MISLGPDEIRRLLPMAKAVEAMRRAFAAHAETQVQAPRRTVLHTGGGRGSTLVMSAALESESPPLLVTKVVSVFPDNRQREMPPIHSTVLAVDSRSGKPVALMEGASLTAIRTAATCGLATDLLARPDSEVLAVFGSGTHARAQVRSMVAVRPIRKVRIFNPNRASARAMASELGTALPVPGGYRAARTPAEALDGADVACAATTSQVPVFDDADVPEGIHINAIGSFKPREREVPGATVARAVVVVDDRGAALEEAGDLLIPLREGLLSAARIRRDLGSLVLGRCDGRESAAQVTFFKSVGLAVQDVVAAQAVLSEARAARVGNRFRW